MKRQRRFISIPPEVIEKLIAGESPAQTLRKMKRDILQGKNVQTR